MIIVNLLFTKLLIRHVLIKNFFTKQSSITKQNYNLKLFISFIHILLLLRYTKNSKSYSVHTNFYELMSDSYANAFGECYDGVSKDLFSAKFFKDLILRNTEKV